MKLAMRASHMWPTARLVWGTWVSFLFRVSSHNATLRGVEIKFWGLQVGRSYRQEYGYPSSQVEM